MAAALAILASGTTTAGIMTTSDASSQAATPAYKAPTVYVRNVSSYVTDAEVKNALPAFQAAVSKDFAPFWNADAHLVFIGKNKAPVGKISMTLFNNSPVDGALAYHWIRSGAPGASVFVGTSKYYGYSWTVGFTHELFEMLVDPYLTRVEQNYNGPELYFSEVADPVEADEDGYTRPGANGAPILISDFITDNWFGGVVAGPYDFMNRVHAPFEVRPGGYAQYWNGLQWVMVDKFRKGRHDQAWVAGEAAEHDD